MHGYCELCLERLSSCAEKLWETFPRRGNIDTHGGGATKAVAFNTGEIEIDRRGDPARDERPRVRAE